MEFLQYFEPGHLAGFWLIVLIAMLVVEISTVSLTSIWFAVGALFALIAALLGAPVAVQVILFFVAAIVLIIILRPVSVRYFNKNREKTNVESLIGREAVVTEDIDNIEGRGQASVNGVIWTARMKEKRMEK